MIRIHIHGVPKEPSCFLATRLLCEIKSDSIRQYEPFVELVCLYNVSHFRQKYTRCMFVLSVYIVSHFKVEPKGANACELQQKAYT